MSVFSPIPYCESYLDSKSGFLQKKLTTLKKKVETPMKDEPYPQEGVLSNYEGYGRGSVNGQMEEVMELG